ncbi:hypothetical protein, partial [Pseudomonas bohemica]|uniref:hypothetical protein n=1 Tax=Pseudomonas bohemica TaxID=2044872 RepID=UPI001F27B655
DCAFFPNPLVPPEERSEGVNLIQDGTVVTKKPPFAVAFLWMTGWQTPIRHHPGARQYPEHA